MNDEDNKFVGITVAGIDYVQNGLEREEKRSFFQDMVFDRPELVEKLGVWFDYIHEKKGTIPNIREVTFDLLKDVLDRLVESDNSEWIGGGRG